MNILKLFTETDDLGCEALEFPFSDDSATGCEISKILWSTVYLLLTTFLDAISSVAVCELETLKNYLKN